MIDASIATGLTAIASVVTAAIGYQVGRMSLNNTPAMQKNAQAAEDQAEINKINSDITKASSGDSSGIKEDIQP